MRKSSEGLRNILNTGGRESRVWVSGLSNKVTMKKKTHTHRKMGWLRKEDAKLCWPYRWTPACIVCAGLKLRKET